MVDADRVLQVRHLQACSLVNLVPGLPAFSGTESSRQTEKAAPRFRLTMSKPLLVRSAPCRKPLPEVCVPQQVSHGPPSMNNDEEASKRCNPHGSNPSGGSAGNFGQSVQQI
jgi:hypothetical protein